MLDRFFHSSRSPSRSLRKPEGPSIVSCMGSAHYYVIPSYTANLSKTFVCSCDGNHEKNWHLIEPLHDSWPLFLKVKAPQDKAEIPTKTRVIWVLGIVCVYIEYAYLHTYIRIWLYSERRGGSEVSEFLKMGGPLEGIRDSEHWKNSPFFRGYNHCF